MPSSPKFFHARSYSSSIRIRSTVLNVCFLIGSLVFFIGLVAIARRSLGYRCINVRPNTVSIAWETVRNGNADDHVYRRRAMGFVGVFTAFGSAERRRSLRLTWMPSQRHDLHSLEEATGLVFKFIIGRTSDKAKMSVIMKEVAEFDDFIILDIKEEDSKLPYKTLAFFKAAYALYDCDFYVKSDDGIYLRPDRLSLLLAKERAQTRTYLGCMKKGLVFSDPKLKWYEPLSTLLGKEYFMHAYGPLYALSADVVASMVALRNNSFRMFKNEDVTIGAWMLAMNVNYEDNRQLCQAECTSTSIAVWDIPKCSGLCNPETKLLELHKSESCSGTSTLDSD